MPLQIRRGPTLDREAYTPLVGELIYDQTTGGVFVGDGETPGGLSVSNFTQEDAQDAVAAVLAAGTHVGITFEYNDSLNKLNATVGGEIVATINSEGSVLLVDSVLGSINLDGTVKGNITPAVNATYDLGTDSFKFRDLYLSGSSIHLGSALITATGTAVNLPAGSKVDGVLIGSGSGDGVIAGSNYNINIVGDDSTLMVNTSAKVITAANGFVGNITGNVTGNVLGNVQGALTGNSTGTHNGNVNDGTALMSNGTITASSFQLGSVDSSMNLTLNLNNNLQVRQVIDPVYGKFITMTQSRGTLTSPAAAQPGDQLGGLLCRAYTDGTTSGVAGIIGFVVDPTAVIAGGDFIKTKAIISASSDTDNAEADAFVLDSSGLATVSRISLSDGTAADPSIVFSTDGGLDTGFSHPGDGIIVVSTNATEKVRIDTGGMRVVGFMKVGGFATASLPSPAEAGMIVLDTDTGQFKGHNGSAWVVLG